MERYDVQANKWETLSPLLSSPRSTHGVAASV